MTRMRLALLALVALGVTAGAVAIVLIVRDGDEGIPAKELRGYPEILLVWGPTDTYTATGDLYLVRADGTGLRLLRKWGGYGRLNQPYGAYDALWSLERDSIVFEQGVDHQDPDWRVVEMDLSKGDLQPLTGFLSSMESWLPGGSELVFRDSRSRLHAVSPAGGASRPIRVAGARYVNDLDWSPDGRHIVASTYRGVVVMDTDGRNVVHLTRGDISAGLSNVSQTLWSPDGRSILFTRWDHYSADESLSDVYVISADGGRERRLTTDGHSEAMDWSPDGSKVLFLRQGVLPERRKDRGSDLWVMDVDGERQTRLPFNRAGWNVLSADWGS